MIFLYLNNFHINFVAAIVMMQRFLCGISALLLLAGCRGSAPEGPDVQPGDPLPSFLLEMADGSSLTNAELKGMPSLILFFHTSCSDCQRTIPVVQQAYEQFGETLRFVAVSRGQSKDEVSSWWHHNGITIPYSAQKDRKVYELFALSRIPRIYVSGSDGIVQACFHDNPCPDYETLSAALARVTAQ